MLLLHPCAAVLKADRHKKYYSTCSIRHESFSISCNIGFDRATYTNYLT